MTNEDQKIRDLMNAAMKTSPSDAFVQNVMRRVRQEPQTRPLWSQWLTWPRLTLAGAGFAALLFILVSRQPETTIVAATEESPAIIYTASLIDTATSDTIDTDSETEDLIESYFL